MSSHLIAVESFKWTQFAQNSQLITSNFRLHCGFYNFTINIHELELTKLKVD